ncbi:hypothetical protein GM3709_2241 [Geminocystis sp. NIES-3709]|nr:hypothetical protein GM3709_2241 [Geminocystis sp. NIES-3709]
MNNPILCVFASLREINNHDGKNATFIDFRLVDKEMLYNKYVPLLMM